jgi:predicted nucleic acid-binding protein
VKSLEKNSNSEILIDTCIIIDYYKKRKIIEIEGCAISIISLLEFLRGIPENKRKGMLNLLKCMFKVINVDDDIILKYCKIYNDLKRKGKMLDDADLLIGCTAIAKGYKLFTNNKKHFERLKDYDLKFYEEGEDDK